MDVKLILLQVITRTKKFFLLEEKLILATTKSYNLAKSYMKEFGLKQMNDASPALDYTGKYYYDS